MQTILYSRAKLLVMTLLCCVGLPIIGLILLATLNPVGWIMGVLFLIAGPISGLVVMAKLVLGGAAVAYNDRQVTLSTLWTSRTVPWSDVQSVSINRTTLKLWGFIPLNKIDHLEFQLNGETSGTKKVNLAFNLMALSVADANDVIDNIDRVRRKAPQQAGVTPEMQVSRADYDPLLGAPRARNFDPDAALARYLASKSGGGAGEPEATQAPMPSPVVAAIDAPQRPVFGRKAA
jgi:hypothetical protein